MGYIVEYRDESQYDELVEKMKKAKKAVCEAMEAIEEHEDEYGERSRGSYRSGMRGGYRGGYREMDDEEERMEMRRSRDGRGRYM